MKTVGKQLEEARLARNWTPEMAARETKIKVDRIRDLESDNYSNFNNATYARGFVRTYARALGLDEYRILRQLDNKLPDDDTANIVSAEGGVAYLPETALPPRVAHRDFTGLYVVLGLGAAISLIMLFVLVKAYQVGELGQWVGGASAGSKAAATTNAPVVATDDSAPRAKPIDSNTPPPIPDAVTNTAAATPAGDLTAAPGDAAAPPRALPVDTSAPAPVADTPSAATPPPADIPTSAPRAMPVNPAELAAAAPVAAAAPPAAAPPSADLPLNAPRALPVSAADLAAASAPTANEAPLSPAAQTPPPVNGGKPLILTASRDSFVRVTALDTADGDKPVYAAVLHSGQSVAFSGHKFSVAVDHPSAVDIKLDGVNYGPHSDGSEPETFTVVSHVQ